MGDGESGKWRRTYLRIRTNLHVWMATVICVTAGAAVVLFAGTFGETLDAGSPKWFDFLVAVGSSLMGVGVLALIFEVSTRRAVTKEVLASVGLKDDVNTSGVLAMPASRKDARAELVNELPHFSEADLIYVASKWLESNAAELRVRLSRPAGARIRVLLPNPDDDELLGQLLTRFSYDDLSRLKAEVRLAVHAAFDLRADHPARYVRGRLKSGVEVKWLPVVPTYALLWVGNRGVLEFYEMRKALVDRPPTLVFAGAGTLATFARDDFEALWEAAVVAGTPAREAIGSGAGQE